MIRFHPVRVGLVAAFLYALVAAAPVAAAGSGGGGGGGMSLTITSASLSARVAVTLNFRFVCSPITDFNNANVTGAIYGASATVDQASGRSIAHGTSGDTMPSYSNLATCDGTTVNNASVVVISSTVPFHGGAAIVSVSVYADDPNCLFCGGGDYATIQTTVRL